jgi:hypothetical protein
LFQGDQIMADKPMCWWHPKCKATHTAIDNGIHTPACGKCAKVLIDSKATGEWPSTRNMIIKKIRKETR